MTIHKGTLFHYILQKRLRVIIHLKKKKNDNNSIFNFSVFKYSENQQSGKQNARSSTPFSDRYLTQKRAPKIRAPRYFLRQKNTMRNNSKMEVGSAITKSSPILARFTSRLDVTSYGSIVGDHERSPLFVFDGAIHTLRKLW